jgi:hypothetical protein
LTHLSTGPADRKAAVKHTLLLALLLLAGCSGAADEGEGGASGLANSAGAGSGASAKTWAEFVEWAKRNNCAISTAEGLIKDRSQLSDPTKIIKIGAGGSSLSDLSPFAETTALRGLYLGGTRVSDLSPLAGLTSLEYLDISQTQVTDLSPLMNLPNLKEVGVNGTPVSDENVAKLRQALPNCNIYGKR